MKKTLIILIVVVVALLGVSLSACGGNAPLQSTLQEYTPWVRNVGGALITETSVFDVTANVGSKQEKGVYTVVVQRYQGTTATVVDKTVENFNGYSATSRLKMDNGDYQNTDVLFTTNLQVEYSVFESKTGDNYSKRVSNYDKKKCLYTLCADEANPQNVTNGTIKYSEYKKSPYYDNAMIYLVARCFPTTSATYSYQIPNYENDKLNKVVMSAESVKQQVDFANGQKTSCRVINIAYNRTFPGAGAPLKCYISEYEMNGENVITPPKEEEKPTPAAAALAESKQINSYQAIAKIVEGNVTYLLKSITSILNEK
ncbi:MAG: hypothetical protein RSB61_02775 [Clostridia bacterium]